MAVGTGKSEMFLWQQSFDSVVHVLVGGAIQARIMVSTCMALDPASLFVLCLVPCVHVRIKHVFKYDRGNNHWNSLCHTSQVTEVLY